MISILNLQKKIDSMAIKKNCGKKINNFIREIYKIMWI